MQRHTLHAEQQQEDKHRGQQNHKPENPKVSHRIQHARGAGDDQKRADQPRKGIYGHNGQPERRPQCGKLGGKHSRNAHGHGAQNQTIAPVWKQCVPKEQSEHPDDRHGGRDEELLIGPRGGVKLLCRQVLIQTGVLGPRHERQHQAEGRQQRRELREQRRQIAAHGNNVRIEEAVGEQADQRAKLAPFAARRSGHCRTTSAIWRAVASGSVSVTSWEKMSSSVGRAIKSRSLPMESLATTRPLWRITTRWQTFSTTSSTCELNSTVLPEAASDRIRLRSTRPACTSSPEKGSSRMISSGSWRIAAQIRIFWRMPLE